LTEVSVVERLYYNFLEHYNLDKADTMTSSKASSQGDGAPDSEVTPAMVEAGIAAVRPREYELWESRTPSELSDFVTAIYLAMRSRESER
jgi:hypothetical protein